jgi:hypothetical protein
VDLNLIMGVLWLLLGGALLVFSWTDPVRAPRLWETNISIGWVGIVLALYNFARWWNRRSYVRQQQQLAELSRRREQRPSDQRTEEERDPTFDFTAEK